MPLVPLHEIYVDANKNYYAIGQFNVSNLELIQATLEAAQEMKSPVILATSKSAIKYAGLEYLIAMVKAGVNNVTVPVVLHLDHGTSFEDAKKCIEAGFTSVMIDGSALPFKENVKITREVVDFAHMHNITVEAELGKLGGIEDEVKVNDKETPLTDPAEAEQFVTESRCDSLAIAVGTSHGAYKFKGEAKLDFDRIKTIKKRLGIPLVLHGASGVPEELTKKLTKYGGKIPGAKGVPDEAYRKAIQYGINKVNIDTDLRLAFTSAIRETLTIKPDEFDPRKILGTGRKAVKEIIKHKIEVLGSAGKA